jgi:hypothetical protein
MTKKRTEGAGIHGPQERGSKTVSKTKRPGDCAPNTPPAGRAMRLLRQRDHDIEAMIQRELESAPAVDQQEKNVYGRSGTRDLRPCSLRSIAALHYVLEPHAELLVLE